MTISTNQNIALAVLVFDFVIFHLVMNINTMSLLQSLGWNLDLWPKRIGQETDTVYLKSFPEFASIIQLYQNKYHINGVKIQTE